MGAQSHRRRFRSITQRAHARFEARDWASIRRDQLERIDAYEIALTETLASLERAGLTPADRDSWSAARALFRADQLHSPWVEIDETFFNSAARRIFGTKGIDPHLEFLAPAIGADPPDPDSVSRGYAFTGDRREVLASILRDCRFQASWSDQHRDLELAAARLPSDVEHVDVLDSVLYRGKGAYIVGRLAIVGGSTEPFALAVRHERSGLRVGAVLVGERDLSILFSYTRAAFLVAADHPASVVGFLSTLLPGKPRSELYASIGFRKHAKTEGYRELMAQLEWGTGRFVLAEGVPGLVMLVFTLEGFDVVFKVIRDRFPAQKSVTRTDVEGRYRIVSRHDRAGRLVEAHRFVDLRLPLGRCDEELLDQLLDEASRSVSVDVDEVTFSSVYVERKVVPLDVFLASADPESARNAILDYGNAIKNLAASNIFPGDMLLKNFGVTNRGRVVFYDYDEIGMVTDLRFRAFPHSDDPTEEMSFTPAFGVGPNDVFPEELERFLGFGGELREAFDEVHRDIFGTEFWQSVQERLDGGETIEILPYRRSRALEGP